MRRFAGVAMLVFFGPTLAGAAQPATDTVDVCFSSAGTRFDRLTARECEAQGWKMRAVPREDVPAATGGRGVGGASRVCRDGQWRTHCEEDGAPAERAPSAYAEAMKTLEARDIIMARCQEEWPGNFRMQAHCLERQQKGARDVQRWVNDPQVKSTPELQLVVANCGGEWSDQHGYNWPMVAHCIEGQVTAYRRLR